ncbi:TRAP transporter small permease [Salibacterium halotolerans]|uniref:TRAP-type C4-dicarboxylate transport system, small permease component n=1 Tax=Salibacterium halotolerans TaxID=1884432 RepID=A0A1I5LAL9_9BACI|nr:TRAP transporter small permease [Salibacterium halotolerans]SFO94202.1 TRAP-type C4-dicarboxylate transport system, small permease component [Salibacterium halotolerans]
MSSPEANAGKKPAKLYTAVKVVNKITDFTAGALTVVLLIVVLTQVIGRLLEQSPPWTVELTRYVFIWMIFLGVSLGFRKDESPRITFFVNLFPQKTQKVIMMVTLIVTYGFFVFLFFTGLSLMGQQMDEISPVLRVSIAWVGLCMPVSACLSIFNLTQFLFSPHNEEQKGEK